MSDAEIQSRLQTLFPALYSAVPQPPISAYHLVNVPADHRLFDIGSACKQYLLLTAGSISVKMLSKSGKSILLYRVEPGQSCIITTSCLLGNANYPTFGETETDIEALSISQPAFAQAIEQSTLFRQFVFDSLGKRLHDVMAKLESVNFTSIDSRIANTLLARKNGAARINVTHEALAEEVGTAREVISRHLKQLERKQLITLERGAVVLIDTQALSELCE